MIIEFPNGWKANIIESTSQLPDMSGVKKMYLDVETNLTTIERKVSNSFLGDDICGIAVLRDDENMATYIPIRHTHQRWNVELEPVQRWLWDTLRTVPEWINHNIKFDAHFVTKDAGCVYDGRLIDTLTLSKMHNTDRFGHALKPLCRDWLNLPMEEVDVVAAYLEGIKKPKTPNSYANVPADILGKYACEDVFGNRELYKFLYDKRPEQLKDLWETEIKMTSVLYDIERKGMKIDRQELQIESFKSIRKLIEIAEKIKDLTGIEYVDSNKHLYDLFIIQYGLPVLAFTQDSGNPSFDKDVLQLYTVHPQVLADSKLALLVDLVIEYRAEQHHKSLFLDSYLLYADENEMIHPSYNQLIRTSRMSCAKPNFQQLNKRAKKLIKPSLDRRAFLRADACQIEFRLIVHYIQDPDALKAYEENRDTDFHMWVAELCNVKRGPAKNINFAIGYGAGKRKVTAMLSGNPDVMEEVGHQINKLIEAEKLQINNRDSAYRKACYNRASEIYTEYHARLPGLKRLSLHAMNVCKRRGFVFNPYGRRRHLTPQFAHKAFNSIVQGGAMDFIKNRMIALAPRYNSWMRDLDLEISANVHDELLFEGPEEVCRDPQVQQELNRILEEQEPVKFRVPLTWSMGISTNNWAEASSDEATLQVPAMTV